MSAIPQALRERARWIVWRWGELDPATGKRKKPPYCPSDISRHASCTNPATWGTFEQAIGIVEAGKADGIGYAACAPEVFIDLDAELSEADQAAVMLALDSYSERSPSGEGYHVVIRGNLNGRGRHPQGIGVFQENRFFYFTGEHVRGTPTTIEERQAELEDVLARFLPADEVTTSSEPPQPVPLDDQKLLEHAFEAKNGEACRRLTRLGLARSLLPRRECVKHDISGRDPGPTSEETRAVPCDSQTAVAEAALSSRPDRRHPRVARIRRSD